MKSYHSSNAVSRPRSRENSTVATVAGDLREQVATHVMMKEDLLKREEAKIREMELKMQRELEAKRLELMRKEKTLKEIVSLRLFNSNLKHVLCRRNG
jgi:hypothetical protein